MAASGSLALKVPKGVSTFTLSPSWVTCEPFAMWTPTKTMVAMPRTPMPTITAMTMRTTLRALLPPAGGGATGGGAATTGAPPAMAAPHLLQNFVSGVRAVPQELQNAIFHLAKVRFRVDARV